MLAFTHFESCNFVLYVSCTLLDLQCRDAYQGALSEEEMAALEQAAREKSMALALIEAREGEIRAIRDGQLTSKKVSKTRLNIPCKFTQASILLDFNYKLHNYAVQFTVHLYDIVCLSVCAAAYWVERS